MEIDITTLNDLSIFNNNQDQSVFDIFNHTRTNGGRAYLQNIFLNPQQEVSTIVDVQKTIQHIVTKQAEWPLSITNGTIMVMEKFFETHTEKIPPSPHTINSFLYKLFHTSDYGLIEYSVHHFTQFIQGFQQIIEAFADTEKCTLLHNILSKASTILSEEKIKWIIHNALNNKKNSIEVLRTGYFLKYHFKNKTRALIELYSQLDAYYSMALAVQKYQLHFPTWVTEYGPAFHAEGLYHPLLKEPVAYAIQLQHPQQFLFLTGANMAGKSTFIKAIGIAVFLAHIGMGVPAQTCSLSIFDGLLSNIQIADNIGKGESYFFNEVQRVKQTILKISNGKRWFILIDELFKGTNVQDAMQCSTVVIQGLLQTKESLFILSTHLYEIADVLQLQQNIQFKFFETQAVNGQLAFNYKLRDGVSKDRIGYLILKREKVVELLEQLR